VTASAQIARRRILVVEDEAIIAIMLEFDLKDMGYDVIGPAPCVETALQLIDNEPLDFALLDYRLGDETSESIASALAERQIPFLFMTGHCVNDLPFELRAESLLQKPVNGKALRHAIEAIFEFPKR